MRFDEFVAGMKTVKRKTKRTRDAQRGFTLLEMMVVITIMLVLATIAAGRYDLAAIRAHEAALHTDLTVMNQAIQDYTTDKNAAPTSLEDLVPQYIGRIPNDPMTGTNDWAPENCDMLLSADQTLTGICSVHSSSDKISPFSNDAYSSWTW
jgi:general secretion pathway protein G